MAAVTWSTNKKVQALSPSYTPVSYSGLPGAREEYKTRFVGTGSSVLSTTLSELCWRYMSSLNAASELLLLFLVGVSSTVTVFMVDSAIAYLVALRARAAQDDTTFFTAYAIWTGSSLLLCSLSVAVVQFIGPSAAGSGIPHMKCVLAGVHIHHYLSFRTYIAKAFSLVLALAGGLSIGKEGPYVHMSSCTAQLLCSLHMFRSIGANDHLRRQVLAAGCAAGVSASFGAPVGGVLFSIEVTSTYYSISHLWKAMFTAVCGSLLFHITRDFGHLALFQLTNFDTEMGKVLLNGEMIAFAFLGVLCGLMGAAFVHATSSLLRRVAAGHDSTCTSQHVVSLLLSRYGYTLIVAFTSAMLTFPFGFFRSPPEVVRRRELRTAVTDVVASLLHPFERISLRFQACKFVFTVIAVGCPISCGVTAGGYAVVGAAAMAAGVTRTVSCAVMVFELTGQLNHLLPRAPANHFSYLSSTGPAFIGVGNMLNKSIYDTFLELNNLPYLVPTVSNLAALKEFLANLKSVFLDSQKPPQLLEDSKRTACDVMDRDARFLICRPSYLDVYLLLQQSDDVECAPLHSLALLHSCATLLCYARSCGSGRREEPYSHRLRPPLHFAELQAAVDSSSEKRNRSNSLTPQEGSGNSSSEEFLESSLSAHSKPEDRLSRVVETVDGPTPQSSEKHLEKGQADFQTFGQVPLDLGIDEREILDWGSER
ncbi:MAG: hypothetical protein SGPRY_005163 [Prymnesium sp.]